MTAEDSQQSPRQALFGLPPIWLRVNCHCAQCRDPATGERLVSIIDLPADVSVVRADRSGNRVDIVLAPDGHRASFDVDWLAQFAPGGSAIAAGRRPQARWPAWHPGNPDYRTEDAKRLWAAADIAPAFPQGSWPLFKADATHRQACLEVILRDGFLVLRDTPAEPGMVVTVGRHFGFIQESAYGALVDVQVSRNPKHLMLTSQAMTPRTGLAFRDPLPTLQFIHCLRAAEGCQTILVDGFSAAAALRDTNRRAFDVLASTEVTWAYADAVSELSANRPVIGVTTRGRIREVRIDPGLIQPLAMPPADVVAFYDAYRAFIEVILRPSQAVTFVLRSGDCLVMDNARILAGRGALTEGTPRHLQLSWAELDGLASALALLHRPQRNGHSRL